jgi:hypothetical protein
MDVAWRRQMLAMIFEAIVVGQDGLKELVPHEGWKPYVSGPIRTARVLRERKSGLKVRNVETTRLARDPRPAGFG